MNKNRKGDWIQTYKGIQFYPLDPRPEDIDIEDIAHALSLTCRFGGHCKEFYSVAQHSIYVAMECKERWPNRKDLHLWGLLHDAGEAYIPDIPRPIKHGQDIGTLMECEKNILKIVVEKYGLHFPEPEEIKIVDNALLATEAFQLMGKSLANWNLSEKTIKNLKIYWFSPENMEYVFLQEFERLLKESKK